MPLAIIVAVGLFLRLLELGRDSFWCDEAGVALVSLQPSLSSVIAELRTHAAAMPLDYVINWLVANVSLNEGLMRLPAAVFGTLTLPICYALFVRLANRPIALLATLLLAVSPLHVHYSQELRFYAALMCFYSLSTYLIFRAIQQGSVWRWAIFVAAAAVGAYFHVYTLLCVVPGLAWLLFDVSPTERFAQLRRAAVSVLVLGVIFLAGYRYFVVSQNFQRPLFEYESLHIGLAAGLGWISLPYGSFPIWNHLWSMLMGAAALWGMALAVRQRLPYLRALLGSMALQIVLIVAADALSGYWFFHRQILPFHPFALFFSALGLSDVARRLAHIVARRSQAGPEAAKRAQLFSGVALLCVLLAVAVPALGTYYRWPKSFARETSLAVAATWQRDDRLLLSFWCDRRAYGFYLRDVLQPPGEDTMHRLSRQQLAESTQAFLSTYNGSGKLYLSILGPLSRREYDQLTQLGFQPLLPNGYSDSQLQLLFVRSPSA